MSLDRAGARTPAHTREPAGPMQASASCTSGAPPFVVFTVTGKCSRRGRGKPSKAVLPKKAKHEHKHAEEPTEQTVAAKAPAAGANARAAARAKKAAAISEANSSSDEEDSVTSGAHASAPLDPKIQAMLQQINA